MIAVNINFIAECIFLTAIKSVILIKFVWTFLRQVISEALRYGNIVKFVHRKAIKDVKFRGIYLNR